MGNKASSGASSSTSSSQPAQEINALGDVTSERTRKGFRQYCGNQGRLDRESFNKSLTLLEQLGLRRVRETPLGDRLFVLFDTSGNGSVDEEEFVKGVSILTGDQQRRKIDLTFRAYDKNNEGQIAITDLVDLLLESWIAAFRFLGEKIKSSPSLRPGEARPTSTQISDFAKKHQGDFSRAAERSLRAFGIANAGFVDKAAFEQWARIDRTVTAQYGLVTVQVAVTFFNIEKPGSLYPTL